jgi:predicted flap endonuclease-1-like 5' DNA nuclease
MPEITVIHIALLAVILVVGIVIGWVSHGNRCAKEKEAINIGWQEQLAAQRSEHDRLSGQNKSLMEQVSQYQASNTDAKLRAKELSDALKEAFERRDELQRQIKDMRSSLEAAVSQRDQLQTDSKAQTDPSEMLKEKDEKIFKLSRELEGWQDRLPPLIERYQARNEDALRLEEELAAAQAQISALDTMLGSDQTRVEPVDPDSLTDGMDASNDSRDDESTVHESTDEAREESEVLIDESTMLGSEERTASGDDESIEDEFVEDEPIDAEIDAEDGEKIRSLLKDFQETATNQLLDDLEDISSELGEDDSDTSRDSSGGEFNASANGELRDNLKKIKGIGPAIEKTLNEMGISRYDQIAEMSEYDIDRVAKRLKGFRSRIYREDWIGQARDLQQRNSDDQL